MGVWQDVDLQLIQAHQNATYIPGDYIKDDLFSLIESHRFDFGLPTCFLWEGEVLHLRRGEVIFVLERIRDNVKNSRIVCWTMDP